MQRIMMQFVNELTKEWMMAYTSNPTAAVLIDANRDMKSGIAIAKQLHTDIVSDLTSPLLVVQPTKTKSIGIDDVRELQQTLSLKANTSSTISRMAAIYHADKLTTEAQNALLKLVEELPQGTIVCLVASNTDSLLETIRSRCFTIPLLPFNATAAQKHALSQGVDNELAARSISMSDGNLSDYLAYIDGHGSESTDQAKQFLQSNVYDRQLMLIQLQKTKQFDASDLLQSLNLICKVAMRRSASMALKQQWKSRLKLVIESEDMLRRNVMSKLVLLRLSILI